METMQMDDRRTACTALAKLVKVGDVTNLPACLVHSYSGRKNQNENKEKEKQTRLADEQKAKTCQRSNINMSTTYTIHYRYINK